jgi:hypothetical protein
MRTLMNFLRYWSVALIVVLLIVGTVGCGDKKQSEKKGSETEAIEEVKQTELSPEVEQILEKKMELVKKLAEDPLTIKTVMEFNEKNRDMTLDEILKIDIDWEETPGMEEPVRSLITSEYAQYLVDFQEANNGFPEIFVTDERGLIVGATNKTSDYYQADEAWWKEAYDQGKGRSYRGDVEYDESAMAEAIPLYVPVIEPEGEKVVGVIKAVCDITAIKLELR